MIKKKAKCLCLGKGLSSVSSVLKTISEDTRLRIICLLGKEERCVCEITSALKLPHNLLLHHLKALIKIGLLKKREQGRFTFYWLDQKAMTRFKQGFAQLIN